MSIYLLFLALRSAFILLSLSFKDTLHNEENKYGGN